MIKFLRKQVKRYGERNEHLLSILSFGRVYRSCSEINNLHLVFNGLCINDDFVAMCCERIENQPSTSLKSTGKETIESLISLRNNLLGDLKSGKPKHEFARACFECRNSRVKKWKSSDIIHKVNISVYPSPCQSKCIYCLGTQNQSRFHMKSEDVREAYELVFNAIEYAEKMCLIASDASWQISCGEITIHPFKDRLLEITKSKHACYLTNCFLYDKEIGTILSENKHSSINFSIDAGTAETWYKVKGVDNFSTVLENLHMYRKNSVQPGQITLKYMILPGVNDNESDYDALIGIMHDLGVSHLKISRDHMLRYSGSEEKKEVLVKIAESETSSERVIVATRHLIDKLKQNGISYKLSFYQPNEVFKITQK